VGASRLRVKYNARGGREYRSVMGTHVTYYLVEKKQSKLNIMYRKPVLKLKPAGSAGCLS